MLEYTGDYRMEIKLSNRMQEVVNLVCGKKVADIGCDHAFVSIYLLQSKKADKVIAMDVKDGPLAIAKENIKSVGLEEYIEVRKSNGFSAVQVGEIDCAIIAGMGGHLILDILQNGSRFTDDNIELILQPQSDIALVREYLYSVGYVIDCEQMLIEEGKYYSIIRAIKGENVSSLTKEQLKFGPYLLENRNQVLLTFLKHSIEKNKDIIAKLNATNNQGQSVRIEELNAENELLGETIRKYFDE